MNETMIPIPGDLQTPFKLNRLVLKPSGIPGSWDAAVDCPFVFRHNGRFHMVYLGHDGIGYQTGLATSDNLIDWEIEGLIMKRDPDNPIIRYNIALSSIVRENDLFSCGDLKLINGKYLGVYHAYPDAGGEEGPAVIGLCWSSDLRNWEIEEPFLHCDDTDAADWERGGLYKPCLAEEDGVFYLVYNAKTVQKPGVSFFDGGWYEQIGVASSTDLKHWQRYPESPIIRNGGLGSLDQRVAGDPCVFKYGSQWAIFYYCYSGNNITGNRVALSPDLRSAVKCEGYLITHGPEGSQDENWACKSSLIWHDGVLYHFYKASSENWGNGGIAVATSKMSDS